MSEPKYVPEDFFRKLTTGKISHNDILIVKDGATTGKTAIVPEDFQYKDACINEHVFRIVSDEGIIPYYLFSILFSSIGQRQIQRVISGAAQKGIVREFVEEILIPVPPLEVQQKIASVVKARREKAKMLKQEAKEIIQQAKKKVEKMILGEDCD